MIGDFSWGDLIRVIGTLGKAGAGMATAFSRQPYPPGMMEAMQASDWANQYARASLDPSHPYFRAAAETEEQRQRGDLVTAIQDIIRANLARRGGAFVNPERRDETVWTALVRGFREAGLRAREMARNRLLEMAGTQSNLAKSYAPMMQAGWLTDSLNRQSRSAGLTGAFDTAIGIGDWMKQRGGIARGKESVPDAWKQFFG